MDLTGSQLGSYRLISRLGAGGMGEVWKAEDSRLGRMVAIKILPEKIASDPEAIARMRREARTAAQISHPNIATIHAFEEIEGRRFIVMELVAGESLTSLVQRGPMPEAEACRIARDIADALAEAHAKGIIHRDIKPDNVMVSGTRVKVLDFGIARQMEPKGIASDDPTAFLTQQGFIIGTVNYMSPEQALGKQLDARTDVFSLGVVVYEMLSGRLPFRGETATETITRIVRDEPAPLRGVSPEVTSIVRRCLAKEKEKRFASASELTAALDAHLSRLPTILSGSRAQTVVEPVPRRSRVPWIAGVAALVLLIGVGAFVASRLREQPAATTSTVAAVTSSPESAEPAASTAGSALTVTELAQPAAAEPPPAPATRETAEEVAEAPAQVEPSADELFEAGVARLLARDPVRAAVAFKAAVRKDPNHARAHFRLGEMALFLRDFPTARTELTAALANGSGLPARERKLAELGLALMDRNRAESQRLLRELQRLYPRDPDLARFRELIAPERHRPRKVQTH